MNALRIALKDIQIYLKDRANIVNLFLVPLAFIFAISMAVPGFGAEEGEPIELPVVNLDPGGEASRALIADLNAGGAVQVELYDQDEALALLDDFGIAVLLTIPVGFSQDIEAGRPITLQMLNHPNADEQEIEALLRAVNGVAQQSSLIAQLIASLSQMGEMQAAGPDEPQAFTPNRNVAQAQSQFERAKTAPLVVVEQTRPQALVEAVEDPNVLQQNVPGYTIIIVFATAGLTAASIFDEKKVGSFRRLLAAPISKATILAGKMIPNFAIALIQVVVIFAVSILVLPSLGQERLTLGDDPLALVLVSLALALCSTAFGVLIAALARTEGQINTVGGLGVWVLGALGGCIIPIFLLEGMSLGPISRLTPHNWAIRAYHDLLIRGRGLADVTTEIIALLVFSAVFFAIGLWRFEFD
jgi:ABC-2 type transport system permease protein